MTLPARSEDATVSRSPAERGAWEAIPSLTLPRGGGAIRGIGEKFAANPVTGTASVTIPIATSPGRSGFGPQLALSYDSGSGNGPFGFGWSLSLPTITRKTDKGLPRYDEVGAFDVFMFAGAEDLVPVSTPADVVDPTGYAIQRYRPRIEGLFARIERWTETATGDVHWRSISRDNVTTIYGRDNESRIFDPADPDPQHPRRIYSWLVSESYDDKGNAIVYRYQAEDSSGVEFQLAHERNRTPATRGVNRYLKRVLYGNTVSHLDPGFANTAWLFEVVFDYEQGYLEPQPPDALGRARVRASASAHMDWPTRVDPFSNYRAGFEVRTYRLCRRALMFHHFRNELGVDDYLVRSTELSYDQNPIGSFAIAVVQSGYVAESATAGASTDIFLKQSLPPLEFEYSKAVIQDRIDEADPESIENLPADFDGRRHQWVDLDGEGLSGVLAEQARAWYYKPNEGGGRLGTLQEVAPAPSLADLTAGRQQLLDLTGDGMLNLAVFEGAAPGFYERTSDRDWDTFRSFDSLPRLDWNDPNLRFVDLTGDGFADLLVTEQTAIRWHPSLGEDGFGGEQGVTVASDEERGPRLVFADGTESIYLADLTGDGLADLVRIRNGEICYWPNLGYGRFGAKVTMDGAPWFDPPDLFDHDRIRLADIDGSGTTDIIYLGRERVSVYRNQCGNDWAAADFLATFPPVDDLTTVTAMDFLGNGTACLVWSSPLPNDARRALRYVDLMGGQKPHLLVLSRNNLGAETRVHYAPSTRFYLSDRREGRPWVTRLPFPVHVVDRVESLDLISRNLFVTRYAYHHGYYDGVEREFRGFGLVEQWDTEELATLAQNDAIPAATNLDASSNVPPMLTRTWFHTGAFIEGQAISRQFEGEYWKEPSLTPAAAGSMLLPDTVLPSDRRLRGGQRTPYTLTDQEVREACRALKGAILRQETYAVDGTAKQGRPYSVSERNYTIELLQPKGVNQHSVFFTYPREAVSFQYERTTYSVGGVERYDPRVSHTFMFEVDDFGNPLRSATVAYGRRMSDAELETLFNADGLANVAKPADRVAQRRTLMSFTENRYTNAVDRPGLYRAPLPCESRTYQLFGAAAAAALASVTNLFTLTELQQRIAQVSDGAHEISFRDFDGKAATGGVPWRRLIQHSRTLYRSDFLTGPADGLLPLGTAGSLALPGEAYRLAYPAGLVDELFEREGQPLIPNQLALLATDGGYVRSQEQKALQLFPVTDPDDQWWVPSGRVLYSEMVAAELTTARAGFFLPRRFRNPFGGSTNVRYDSRSLLLLETEDALGNRVTAGERDTLGTITRQGNDYRVLAPTLVMEPNRNRTEVAFDALGMVTATCVMGKPEETLGDRVSGLVRDLGPQAIASFFVNPRANAAALTRDVGIRIVYDIDAFYRTRLANPTDPTRWEPTFAASMSRETHASDPAPAGGVRIQIVFSYSDGFGREVQKKIQAEPGQLTSGGPVVDPRWVGSGWTVFNNKGKPVRKYEPFFDDTHRFRFGRRVGVGSIIFYDAAERCVGTLHPNHTWEKTVFDPWRQVAWDVNDTSAISTPSQDPEMGAYFARLDTAEYLPSWVDLRTDATRAIAEWPGTDPVAVRRRQKEQEAAAQTVMHAATPSSSYMDALGRLILVVSHNRTRTTPADDVRYPSRVWFDVEGNQRELRDAVLDPTDAQDLGRLVVTYDYDMAGSRIRQRSFEAGSRWSLADASGNPIRLWDSRGHTIETGYDPLRRAVAVFVSGGSDIPSGQRVLAERTEYGEGQGETFNHRLRVYRLFDGAGRVTHDRYDFKGNLERSRRRLLIDYSAQVDWQTNPSLSPEEFTTRQRVDALGRPVQVVPPYSRTGGISVVQNAFNEANMLDRVDVWREQAAEPTALLDPTTATDSPITGVDYDAKGQRTRIAYGNGVTCRYAYDDKTFRLTRIVARRPTTEFPADCPNPPAGDDLPTRVCGVQNLQYVYDPAGNVTHIHDDAQQTIYYSGAVAEPSADYTYDALYRLITAKGREHAGNAAADPPSNRPGWKPHYDFNDWTRRGRPIPEDGQAMVPYTEGYVYDALGNLAELSHQVQAGAGTRWVRRYDYRAPSLLEAGRTNNRLTSSSFPGDAAAAPYSATYTYDAHGNVTSMPHLPAMVWDFRDRLHATQRQVITTTTAGGAVPVPKTWYVYDGTGQRVRKVTEASLGNPVNERIYVGAFEVYREYAGTALSLERETLHVMDDVRPIALIETKTRDNGGALAAPVVLNRYALSNHLGSARLELDETADIISYEEYYPYGATSYQAGRSATEVQLKRYRFTGKERDEESGFYYHGARYYAPWLGRWISCDRRVPEDGLNSYHYVRSNPIVYKDPDGKNAIPGATPQQQRAYVKALEQLNKETLFPLLNQRIVPVEEDHTPVLMLLPDGSGYIGPRSQGERVKRDMTREIAVQRTLRTGANIAGGIGGAIGYGIGGNEGSDVGAVVDALAPLAAPIAQGIKDRVQKSPPAAAPAEEPATKTPGKDPVPPKDSQPSDPAPRYDPETAVAGNQRANLDYNKRNGDSFEAFAMDRVRPAAKAKYGDYYVEQEQLGGYFGRGAQPEAAIWSRTVPGEVDVIIDAKSGGLTDAQTKVYIDYLSLRGPTSKPGILVFLIPEGAFPKLSPTILDYLKGKPVKITFQQLLGWTADYPRKESP